MSLPHAMSSSSVPMPCPHPMSPCSVPVQCPPHAMSSCNVFMQCPSAIPKQTPHAMSPYNVPMHPPAATPHETLCHPHLAVPVSPGWCWRPRPGGHCVPDGLRGGGPAQHSRAPAPGQPRAATSGVFPSTPHVPMSPPCVLNVPMSPPCVLNAPVSPSGPMGVFVHPSCVPCGVPLSVLAWCSHSPMSPSPSPGCHRLSSHPCHIRHVPHAQCPPSVPRVLMHPHISMFPICPHVPQCPPIPYVSPVSSTSPHVPMSPHVPVSSHPMSWCRRTRHCPRHPPSCGATWRHWGPLGQPSQPTRWHWWTPAPQGHNLLWSACVAWPERPTVSTRQGPHGVTPIPESLEVRGFRTTSRELVAPGCLGPLGLLDPTLLGPHGLVAPGHLGPHGLVDPIHWLVAPGFLLPMG